MGRACVIVSATVKYSRIIILGVFDIKYMPRTPVKEVLTNLVAEFTEPPLKEVAATQSMDEESIGIIPCKNLYSGRYMLMV